ncbi:MAG: hypothetical protein AAF657_17665 [Acidobacteriota bacterium]
MPKASPQTIRAFAALLLLLFCVTSTSAVIGQRVGKAYTWYWSGDDTECLGETSGLVCAEWLDETGFKSVCCISQFALGTSDPNACVLLLDGGLPVPPRDDEIE